MEYSHDDDNLGDVGFFLDAKAPPSPKPAGGAQRQCEIMFSIASFQEEDAGNLLSDIYKLQNFDSEASGAGLNFEHAGSGLSEELLPRRNEVDYSLPKCDSLSECTDSVEISYGRAVCQDQSRTSHARSDELTSFLVMPQSPDTTLLSAQMTSREGASILLQDQSPCSREASLENAEPKHSNANHRDSHDTQNSVSQSTTSGASRATSKTRSIHSSAMDFVSGDAALVPAPVRGPDGMYSCSFCNMRFKQTGNRKKHIEETHMRRKPFSCSVCHVSFSRKHARDTHQKAVHEQLRPYSCPFCFKLYKNRSDLNKHIRTVEKREKPFSCGTCGRRFGERGKLRRHMAIHTKLVKPEAQPGVREQH